MYNNKKNINIHGSEVWDFLNVLETQKANQFAINSDIIFKQI